MHSAENVLSVVRTLIRRLLFMTTTVSESVIGKDTIVRLVLTLYVFVFIFHSNSDCMPTTL